MMRNLRRPGVWSVLAAALLPWAFSGIAFGGSIQLVRNLNTVRPPQDSNPMADGALNGKLLFGATDATGPGLWSTDGTTNETILLQRLSGSGLVAGQPFPTFLVVGSNAYAVSLTATGSFSLWITNGTAAGTHLVMDFPTTSSGSPRLLAAFGGKLIFSGYDTLGAVQIYITDGTTLGTQALTSFTGTPAGYNGDFVVANSKFYFNVIDNQYGGHIWVSDGTAAGTREVVDGAVVPGSAYNPQSLQLVGNAILYISQGTLWRIDTATDTVSNILAAGDSGGLGLPQGIPAATLVNMGSFALFLGAGINNQGLDLWRSDGTAAGTYKVAAVATNPTFDEYEGPIFFKVGGRVVYIEDDGVHGQQLWSSDGTTANTIALINNVTADTYPFPIAFPQLVIGSTAYLSVTNGAGSSTRSLFRTDGTVSGTKRLNGLPLVNSGEGGLTQVAGDANVVYFGIVNPDSTLSIYRYVAATDSSVLIAANLPQTFPREFYELNGRLFFSNDSQVGVEPWISDGTAAGTQLLKDINPQIADAGSSPDEFVSFAGRLAFVADDGIVGRELWESDGTSSGTKLLADVNPGAASSNPNHLFTANGVLYFFATDATGISKLMRLASPGAGVQTLAALSPVSAAQPYCGPDLGVSVGAQIFFAATDGVSGLELWTSDGTAQGTHLAADIAPGPADSNPCELTVMGNRVYFSASGPQGNELWTSDGTSSGTFQVADIAPGVESANPGGFFVYNGNLYFSADDTVHGQELWRSNGTSTGTALVADIAPGAADSFASPIGVIGGRLMLETLINPTPMTYALQLWSTDGTSRGTTQVSNSSFQASLGPYPIGNFVFLEGQDAAGLEPWVSDGTAVGTHLLKNINAAGKSSVTWFDSYLNLTLFDVTNPTVGDTLWQTDGTSAGTGVIGAIPSQSASISQSNPAALHHLAVGSNFYFAATDPLTGTELYVLSSSAPAATLNATSLSFPSQQVGTASSARAVTVTNTGKAPLLISSIAVVGSQADDFTLTSACGSSLAVGQSCIVSVVFKPVAAGAKSASVLIVDNAPGSQRSIALSGSGMAIPEPALTLSTTALSFASQSVGTASATRAVNLTNTGTAAVAISSIAVVGSQADDFTLRSACGSSLPVGRSCTLFIIFNPVAAGAKAAAILIADNAQGSQRSVALTGTGVPGSDTSSSAKKH